MAYQKASSLRSPVSVYSSDDVEGEEKELRSALEKLKEKGEKWKKKLWKKVFNGIAPRRTLHFWVERRNA